MKIFEIFVQCFLEYLLDNSIGFITATNCFLSFKDLEIHDENIIYNFIFCKSPTGL